ncbi:hypothetical protein BJ508DRAFT_332512 [Ascobolus immersus RN42]|uniref:Uncharacterized protein n=1 Tax=Ascobolus immersus RN42 TaxID=1160509 RepID=A0A3N4HRE4_ASCIM|nr:hypothetical protein BJ508DRAFT_332512 [Ascobolus immersus RN42]
MERSSTMALSTTLLESTHPGNSLNKSCSHHKIPDSPNECSPFLSVPMANADFNDLLQNVPGFNDLWDNINNSLGVDNSEYTTQGRVPADMIRSQREMADIRARASHAPAGNLN